jgi:hypothetical protein
MDIWHTISASKAPGVQAVRRVPLGMFGPVHPNSAYFSNVAAIGMRPCPQHW